MAGGWLKMIVRPAKSRHAVYRWGPTALQLIFEAAALSASNARQK
jgi:hypothetical protein